jgi:hypothetical protein
MSSTQTKTIKVLMLRHGERADEAGQQALPDTLDPELTSKGVEQAMVAWQKIVDCEIFEEDIEQQKRMLIFTSPLQRAFVTAKALSLVNHQPRQQGDIQTIQIVPGLSSCAYAVAKIGGADNLPARVMDGIVERADANDLTERSSPSSSTSSAIKFGLTPSSESGGDSFLASLSHCTLQAHKAGHSACIAVTHREGIREMHSLFSDEPISSEERKAMRKTGGLAKRLNTPYCCVGVVHTEIVIDYDGDGSPQPVEEEERAPATFKVGGWRYVGCYDAVGGEEIGGLEEPEEEWRCIKS